MARPVKKKAAKPLTPPDFDQCQAEKSNGVSFMTLVGRHEMVRCDRPPTVLIVENKPGADGRKGSMTLCDGCLAVFRKQTPKDFATVKDLEDVPHWKKVTCDLCPKPVSYIHPKGGRRCADCPKPTK